MRTTREHAQILSDQRCATVYLTGSTGLAERAIPYDGYGRVYFTSRDSTVQTPARARLLPVDRYAEHDVSDQLRDENGRWAKVGGAGGADPVDPAKRCKATTTRPDTSREITDAKGNFIGRFNHSTGWVTRAVRIGDFRVEEAVAPVDDVVKWLNRANGPVSAADWNDWFIVNGRATVSAPSTAPNYEPRQNQNNEDRLIPQGELRANSGFDSDGRPRGYAASMAGPFVVKLISEVATGLLEKYAGGQVMGLAVNASGKLVVRIAKRGKEVVVELSDDIAKKLRQRVNSKSASGVPEAVQLKKTLDSISRRRIPKVGESHPGLPVRKKNSDDPTHGIFDDRKSLTSGEDGGEALKVFGPRIRNLSSEAVIALKHVEAHAAAEMVQNNLKEAVLHINYETGPCRFCQSGIPELLREGQKLWVVFPDGIGYFTKKGWFRQ